MRLTSSLGRRRQTPAKPRSSRRWAFPAITVGCLAIFVLDHLSGTAPVQHLYYLPIILAAYCFGSRGGLATALAAVALYHLANRSVLSQPYQQSDIIQITLFLAAGAITAKLGNDAERLHILAMTDDLTGLHNLRSFEAQLLDLVRAARQGSIPLSLLVLDVDRLKDWNDRHGHIAGAEAVRTVGHILAANLPPDGVACRYGGDEFVVALPGCTALRAEQIAAGLCYVVNQSAPVLAGRRWPAGSLSISAGVACRDDRRPGLAGSFQSDELEGESLFRAADQALYRAKASGRNCVRS